jgi:cysteinyl-tRNA synthetase
MSHALLGGSFDIHGGGIDLMFPHHENEIAQSRCAHPGEDFARVWMHNGFLQVEGEKMSKSLGNFFTVRDLLARGVPGEVIRFVLLSTHYRQPLDWTEAKVEEATRTLRKWRTATEGIDPAAKPPAAVVEAVAEDLNSPRAMSSLHEVEEPAALLAGAQLIGLLTHRLGDWSWKAVQISASLSGTGCVESSGQKHAAGGASISGVGRVESSGRKNAVGAVPLSGGAGARIAAIARRRDEARRSRDFALADRLREGLIQLGVEVRDTPEGTAVTLPTSLDLERLRELEALG